MQDSIEYQSVIMRRFYKVFSKDTIGETAFAQSGKLPKTIEGRKFYLSWSHYLVLMRISDVDERHFYEIETYRNGWSKSEFVTYSETELENRIIDN